MICLILFILFIHWLADVPIAVIATELTEPILLFLLLHETCAPQGGVKVPQQNDPMSIILKLFTKMRCPCIIELLEIIKHDSNRQI
jgi:hypothetical protein